MSQGYQIKDQSAAHYITLQVVEWADIFTRKIYRDIVISSLKYCQKEKGLEIYAYVIMSNHIHLLVRSSKDDLSGTIRDFKSYTSKEIIKAVLENSESRRDWLLMIFKYAASVVFIDHHISIKDDVQQLAKKYKGKYEIIYDDKKSGATLAWNYFFSRDNTPLFLKLIEDNDIGKWEYEETYPFIYALRTYYDLSSEKKSINKWFKLLNEDNVHNMIKKGKIIQKYHNHLIRTNVRNYSKERFPSKKIFEAFPDLFEKVGQYVVAVYCGLQCPSTSDLAVASMKQDPDIQFCIMWALNLDKKQYVMAMRSRSVDVGTICKSFGGGGHTLAAACSFPISKWRIEDMFHGDSLPRN